VHVTPVVREFVDRIAAEVPRKEATVLRSLLKPRLTDVALRLLGERGTSLEPMLRNTVNATIVRGGQKINVVPSEIELELDGRALPGFSPDALIAEVQAIVGEDVELELMRHDPGPAEPDLGLFETLAEVIRELDPEGIPVPLLQIGVTDGRFFSQAGVQTYGFLPMRLPEGFQFAKLIHAADERIPVDALEFGAEAVWRAIQRFH
jgi:acetylornithine deacetylase/succinyl-diaminopimelate desuccinylase-like protein